MALARMAVSVVGCLAVIGAHSVSAQSIYVAGNGGQFGILDATTGAYASIGMTSADLTGLGYGADGNLYGLQLAENSPTLYRINTQTAALTAVGNVSAFNGSTSLYGIGMGSTSDGTLYAVYGTGSSHTTNTNSLYTISTTTAAATLIGSTGSSGNGNVGGDNLGNLFFVQGDGGTQFDQLSRTTGSATILSANPGFGNVYAVASSGASFYAFNSSGLIYSMNTTTGAATAGATFNTSKTGQIYGAVAVRGAATAPEPGPLALLSSLGLSALPCAAGVIRRRKRAA